MWVRRWATNQVADYPNTLDQRVGNLYSPIALSLLSIIESSLPIALHSPLLTAKTQIVFFFFPFLINFYSYSRIIILSYRSFWKAQSLILNQRLKLIQTRKVTERIQIPDLRSSKNNKELISYVRLTNSLF